MSVTVWLPSDVQSGGRLQPLKASRATQASPKHIAKLTRVLNICGVANYRLIATEIGDLLKWDSTVKHIDRIGQAIFPFRKDNFPNESISSVRAKAIYDWVLSLARHPMDAADRDALLRAFCRKIAPNEELRVRADELLSEAGIASSNVSAPAAPPPSPSAALNKRKDEERAALLERFMQSARAEPHRRGYLLQDILNDLVRLEELEVTRSFTRNDGGEQIDGALRLDGWFYLIECRWRAKLADIRQVDGLKGQVDRSGKQALGIFLSIEGWSENVPELLKQNPEKSILLMDGYDLACVLRNQFSLKRLLFAKNSKLTLECRPFYGAVELQTKWL